MEYEEKINKFDSRSRRLGGKPVTPFEELPFKIGYGSSTGYPGKKGGMQTADGGKVWCKWKNHNWFRPYADWSREQIISMIKICDSDYQIESLIELLSAERVPV